MHACSPKTRWPSALPSRKPSSGPFSTTTPPWTLGSLPQSLAWHSVAVTSSRCVVDTRSTMCGYVCISCAKAACVCWGGASLPAHTRRRTRSCDKMTTGGMRGTPPAPTRRAWCPALPCSRGETSCCRSMVLTFDLPSYHASPSSRAPLSRVTCRRPRGETHQTAGLSAVASTRPGLKPKRNRRGDRACWDMLGCLWWSSPSVILG